MNNELDSGHYDYEDYTQRMDVKAWKKILISEKDKFIFRGRLRQLVAKRLGFGIVEISKKPQQIR